MSEEKKALLQRLEETREVILANVPRGNARTTALALLNTVEINVFHALKQQPLRASAR